MRSTDNAANSNNTALIRGLLYAVMVIAMAMGFVGIEVFGGGAVVDGAALMVTSIAAAFGAMIGIASGNFANL